MMAQAAERPWSPAEQTYARDLLKLRYSLDEIASAVGRPRRAIAMQLREELGALQSAAVREDGS